MLYYAETNLITIIIGTVLLIQGRRFSSKNETSQIIMNGMLRLMVLLSICDIAAYWFRGDSYIGVEVSNILYFLAMAMGTYVWFLFILVKMGYSTNLRRTVLITCLPIVVMCISIFLNPVTNFYFTVDDRNLYHRGPGVILSWVVEWGYMLAAMAFNVRAVVREKRAYRRQEYVGYLIFALPIAVAAACQMLFYGTTTTQVGYMIALLLAFLNKQHYQVQRDELTGLNNRNAFLNYQDTIIARSGSGTYTMFVVDADNFKSINDTYGHLKGDQALRDISEALKEAVGTVFQNRVILFRYGGDEFAIVGWNMAEEDAAALEASVHSELDAINARNREAGEKYTLSVSIGHASGSCPDVAAFDELMKQADAAMYQAKKKKTKR